MATTFFTRKVNDEGMVQIFVRVRSKKTGFDSRLATNLYLDEKIWNNRNDPVKKNKAMENKLVEFVFLTIDDIFKTFEDMMSDGVKMTNEKAQKVLHDCVFRVQKERRKKEEEERKQAELEAKKMTLRRYIDEFYSDAKEGIRLTEKNTVYSKGTLTSIKQAIDHFREFERRSKKTYNFDDIDMDFYRKYLSFLNNQCYALNTIGKNINWLKTLMNTAQTEGYHSNVAFKNKMFKGARVDADSIYLTKEDLEKIRAVDLSGKSPGYELARDIFMIGVWTAQRISDYNNIKKEDIQTHVIRSIVDKEDPEHPGKTIPTVETEEILVVNITQKKTGNRVAVPCSTELRNILEKYNYEIPRMADQNVNDNMKKIAEWAGLDEPIRIDYVEGGIKKYKIVKKHKLVHTHTARRTGATLMYLSGMDYYDIMKITGHSTLQTLKKYIKADQLEVIDKIVKKYDYFK